MGTSIITSQVAWINEEKASIPSTGSSIKLPL